MKAVGFVGLGAMGFPMAGNLAEVFGRVLVHNRTGSVATDHAARFGTVAVGLDGLGEAEALVTCLPVTATVAEVAEVVAPTLAPGTLWIDATSGDPAASRDLATQLRDEHGIVYLDAPVSGGTNGAEAGTLTTMVGAPDEGALNRARPVLDAMCGLVVPVGAVGNGHAAKAINNTLLAANLVTATEGLLALKALGIDPTSALEIFNHASGRSFATEHPLPERIVSGTFDNTFALGLLVKDVGLGMDVLDEAGDPAETLRTVGRVLRAALEDVGGDGDHTELAKHLEHRAGRTLR